MTRKLFNINPLSFPLLYFSSIMKCSSDFVADIIRSSVNKNIVAEHSAFLY